MSDFEKKEGNFGYATAIGGIAGFVMTGLVWWGLWHFGGGAWPWGDLASEKLTFNANFLYFVHFLFRDYVGSIGKTWGEFADILVKTKSIDSFMIQLWFPPVIGLISGLAVSLLVYKDDKKPKETAGYVRGSKIK